MVVGFFIFVASLQGYVIFFVFKIKLDEEF